MFVGKNNTAVSENKCEVSVFMDDLYYKKFEPFWGTWYIKRFIGEGSFGKCYEIEKKGHFRNLYHCVKNHNRSAK